jgi:hypothetical protein
MKGLRKDHAEALWGITKHCPCDRCPARPVCKEECETFHKWTVAGLGGSRGRRPRAKEVAAQ